MRKKPDIILVLAVLVASGVILSNLVIAKAPQNYNKSLLVMQQTNSQSYPYLNRD